MKNSKKKICIISFSDIAWDGRVLRQISSLSNKYDVTVVGHGQWDPPENVTYHRINDYPHPKGIVKRMVLQLLGKLSSNYYEDYYWYQKEHREAYKLLTSSEFDIYHANDQRALPLAIHLANKLGGKVIYDAHEYNPGQKNNNLYFSLFSRGFRIFIVKKYAHQADEMITVSEGLVDLYKRNFNLDSKVVYNASNYSECPFNPVNQESIRIVHHGIATKQRSLEDLVDLTSMLPPNFSLHFHLLKPDKQYYQNLIHYAARVAPDRVHFLEPIDPDHIARTINTYDIGVHLLKGSNLNHQNALPNKLFEFIMAGLCVVTYPLPMMSNLVIRNKIGVVSSTENIKSIVEVLNKLSKSEIEQYKKNSLELAKELNAEVEGKKLLKIYKNLLD